MRAPLSPSQRRAEYGRAEIWTPIWLIAALIGFYSLLKYAPAYIDYYRVTQAFNTVARDSAALNLDNIRYEIGNRIDSINPPFRKDEIKFSEIPPGHVTIDVQYQVEIYHPGLKPHVLTFHPYIEFDRKSAN